MGRAAQSARVRVGGHRGSCGVAKPEPLFHQSSLWRRHDWASRSQSRYRLATSSTNSRMRSRHLTVASMSTVPSSFRAR